MDNLLTLRQVSLFKDMTLAQLSAIAKLLRESEYLSGEVIFKEGEMGTDLYLLIGGSVEVIKDYQGPKERHLTTLQAVNYFGEMAILDDEPRSATIVAAEDTTLLSLNGEAFKELIRDMPDISFEVMRVLTQRIRNVEKRS